MREARGADAEGHRVDVRDVDAGEPAPSFSLATARIALPVSVKRISSQSASATASTTAKRDHARHAMNAGADLDDVEAVRQVDRARVGAERKSSAFSITIARPSVTSRMLRSSPCAAGPMTKRCSP